MRCSAGTQEALSPLQQLSETVRGTIRGRAPRAAQGDRAPSTSSNAARKTVRQTVSGRRRQGAQEAAGKGSKQSSSKKGSRFYWNFTGFPFPLGPLLSRRTIRYEVGLVKPIQKYINPQSRQNCEHALGSVGSTRWLHRYLQSLLGVLDVSVVLQRPSCHLTHSCASRWELR